MHVKTAKSFMAFVFLLSSTTALHAASAVVGFTLTNQAVLDANDDGSTTDAVNLNIGGASGINFFGQSFTQVFVNNNGNVTFSATCPIYAERVS